MILENLSRKLIIIEKKVQSVIGEEKYDGKQFPFPFHDYRELVKKNKNKRLFKALLEKKNMKGNNVLIHFPFSSCQSANQATLYYQNYK